MHCIRTERSDGVGSTIQVYLLCYALARINNIGFCFSSFGEILNFDKDGKSNQQHTEEWNTFFNLQKVATIPEEGSSAELVDSIRLVNSLDTGTMDKFKPFLLGLRESINYTPKVNYFEKGKTNIGIHIRQFVENQDSDRNPVRRCFDGSEDKRDYYKSLVASLKAIENSNIHIFTTGRTEILDFLQGTNVKVHYNENSFSDMYHLITSDILVMANSSFSYVAHLLNAGYTYVDRSFYHPTYSGSKII